MEAVLSRSEEAEVAHHLSGLGPLSGTACFLHRLLSEDKNTNSKPTKQDKSGLFVSEGSHFMCICYVEL